MKKATEKKEAAPAAPPRGKAPENIPSDPESHPHKFHLPFHMGHCKQYCAIASYAAFSALGIMISVVVITVAGLASVATRIYDAEQSSRLMAMIMVAMTGAVTLSMLIYSVIGAFRKKTKALHATAISLVIVAILQALIVAVAITVSAADELAIGKSLADSFMQARAEKPRHVKLWAATQNDLQCCGLNSPEDYRELTMPYFMPPNVPISCCPSYDPSRPAHSQDRQRELCRVNTTYYDQGCKGTVIQVFKETATVIVGVVAMLIVVELIVTILGVYLSKKFNKENKLSEQEPQHEAPTPAVKS